MTNCSLVMPKFCAKMEPRAAKNGATSIWTMDSNSAISKIFITVVVVSNWNEFYQLVQKKCLVLYRRILANLNFSNIFAKTPFPYINFEEKHDEDVAEPVQPTVLELCVNFVQSGTQSHHKWCHLNFDDEFQLGDLNNPITTISSRSNEFDKLAQKTALPWRVFWLISTLPKFPQKLPILM